LYSVFSRSPLVDGFFLHYRHKDTLMKQKIFLLLFSLAAWLLLPSMIQARETLTLMTHDSFNVSKKLIQEFEQQNQVKLQVFKAGDAGAALVQAILSKENPLADVFFGIDNTFFSRALQADIFEPYASPKLADIDDQFKLDRENRLLPVDYGDVCLNYDKAWFIKKGLAPPTDLSALIKPKYRGLTVVENPATSSPGLAFLLATIGRFGEQGYLQFWQQLRDNEVLVVNGWEDLLRTFHLSLQGQPTDCGQLWIKPCRGCLLCRKTDGQCADRCGGQ